MDIKISPEQQKLNAQSHRLGNVDDCLRCVDCEVAAWNTWREPCQAR